MFDRILRASPERYPERDREALERVQQKTRSEKARVHNYPSAAYLRRQYERKIRPGSAAAARVNQTLDRLHLPRLEEVRDEFLALCDRLGVRPSLPAKHRPHRPHPQHKQEDATGEGGGPA